MLRRCCECEDVARKNWTTRSECVVLPQYLMILDKEFRTTFLAHLYHSSCLLNQTLFTNEGKMKKLYPVLQFKDNVAIELLENRAVLVTYFQRLEIQPLSPGLTSIINRLSENGASESELSNIVLELDGVAGLAQFYFYLRKTIQLKFIEYTVFEGDIKFVKIAPISSNTPVKFISVLDDEFVWDDEISNSKKYVLSRFAYCRNDHGDLLLESPHSHYQIVMSDWRAAAILPTLARLQKKDEILGKVLQFSKEIVVFFLNLLLNVDILVEEGKDSSSSETDLSNATTQALSQWEFHDLLFHSRSRAGRNLKPLSLTYRFLGQIEPLPVVKRSSSKESIDLYKPDIHQLTQNDIPFTQVVEQRRSIRNHGEQPITNEQLGEFLYRTARVRDIFKTEHEELSNRPYPNMGACYELEIYLAINACDNVPPGLHYYNPLSHQLNKVSEKTKDVEQLLHYSWLHAHGYYAHEKTIQQSPTVPQILVIIAARFQRVSWAYESLAYAQILKNVGALFQTMYLVATAMDLAACGQAGGNSDLFAKVIESDYYAETSVGEFILGSKPSY